MKVLAFTPLYLPWMGGIEVLVNDLAGGLRKKSIDTVIITDSMGGLPSFELVNGTPVHRFALTRSIQSGKSLDPLLVMRDMAAVIEAENPDVIHLHATAQASAYYLHRLLRKMQHRPPLIATQHGMVDELDIVRDLLLQADVLTAVSDSVLASALSFSNRTGPSLRIYNGIPILRGPAPDRTMPQRHTLLCVGRLQREKGFDIAVEALAIVRRKGIDANLVLIGHGKDRAPLESLASNLGVPDHVTFRGMLDRASTRQAMSEASILLVPSRAHEGFGIVAVEAALAGTPCVASNIGGLPETIADGVSGYIVRPEDPVTMADSVVKLLGDDANWRRMSAAGRGRAKIRFDLDNCVENYAKLYNSLWRPSD
jgi:glycogen synthase